MNIQQMMKQAQQMQGKLSKAQEQLAQIEGEGQSGAGAVKVLTIGRKAHVASAGASSVSV